jgi:acyl carrier protein
MHFGASVREILSASCGTDLRRVPATAVLELEADGARRTLTANLELAFNIDIPAHDAEHWETVRDVLQCVRLRRWEKRATGATDAPAAPPDEVRPVFVTPTRDARERFRRYTPPALPALPPDSGITPRSKRI